MIDERPNRVLAKLGTEPPSPVLPQAEFAGSLVPNAKLESTASVPVRGSTVPASPLPCEADVIRRICAGESELFVELIRPYQKMMYGIAVSIVKNDQDAEEVTQEALFKAFKNLSQFRGDAKFSTWIVQIAMNEARHCLRRQKRAAAQSIECGMENDEGEYTPIDFADWREIPSEALGRKELRRVLNGAISSLKPIYRDVLVLRDIQHFSVAETAKLLGISEASIKTRLLRARFQLRDALAPGFDGYWNTGSSEYKRVRAF